jgi:hypothetical protein
MSWSSEDLKKLFSADAKPYDVGNCRHHPDYCTCAVRELAAEALVLRRLLIALTGPAYRIGPLVWKAQALYAIEPGDDADRQVRAIVQDLLTPEGS